MSRSPTAEDWTCRECGLPHLPVHLEPGEEARCSRCRALLQACSRTGPASGLAWTLASLGFFLAAALLPVLEVSKAGRTGAVSIFAAQSGLEATGMPLLGWLAGTLVVWLPVLALLMLLMVNLSVLYQWRWPGMGLAIRLLLFARKWSMTEVFLLAVLVAFIKVGDLADTEPGPGLWFLAGGALMLISALQRIDRDDLPALTGQRSVRREPSSVMGSVAMLVAALILLVPANFLPIMEIQLPRGSHSNTILGGVRSLAEAGMWGIAAIVFIASILVPFAKIGGLGWLIWLSRHQQGDRWAMRIFRFIEFIGRWSMLDIFLVALLAGLIRFGNLAQVNPGPAAPAFAAVVILTILAVDMFDPRLLWQKPVKAR